MITIPYWWDRKIPSLEATIYKSRPDLFANEPEGHPLPDTIPIHPTKTDTNRASNLFGV